MAARDKRTREQVPTITPMQVDTRPLYILEYEHNAEMMKKRYEDKTNNCRR